MATYILLVRGVTPSGRNKLPMARFREVLEKAGFAHVRTYIQSGNALVDTELPVMPLNRASAIVSGERSVPILSCWQEPGHSWKKHSERTRLYRDMIFPGCFLSLLQKRPRKRGSGDLQSQDFSPEKLAFSKNTAYMYIPGAYGRGTLSGSFLEKRLGVSATMRNFNTMKRLIAMSREIQEKQ